jgi:anti-sigma factor RsiW
MDCGDVREVLLDYQQGRLASEAHGQVRAHLDGCPSCAHEDRLEHELTLALERRLPQYPAPLAFKRRLSAQWPAEASPSATRRPWPKKWAALAVAAMMILVLAPLAWQSVLAPPDAGRSAMVTEAVNDHVRLLQSQRPLEIESSGLHQVIPWFSGRLDFAPRIRFAGDEEFPLRGGAVGYFVDRKAAALVYGRRLHSISLFVFKADGLPWPTAKLEPAGGAEVYRTSARGFNVLLWREGELGYALVSDVNAADLLLLASKLSPSA